MPAFLREEVLGTQRKIHLQEAQVTYSGPQAAGDRVGV